MNVIRCQHLSKHYAGKLALDAIDLSLDAGEPIALVGPNGAGKTTLLSVLCGFVRPSSGSVEVLGQAPGSAALAGRVGALAQDARLDPRIAVGTQLALFARLQGFERTAAQREIERVLALVDLSAVKSARPGELSHGMGKRVAIAQSLIGSPELVLLDEPTAGLDPENARRVRELVLTHAAHTAFIISSHNLDELEKLCASAVYIDNGRVREQVAVDTGASGFITLGFRQSDLSRIVEILEKVVGVDSVARSGQDNLLVRYDVAHYPTMDQYLLQVLAENHCTYKHLFKGRTLEDTLFESRE